MFLRSFFLFRLVRCAHRCGDGEGALSLVTCLASLAFWWGSIVVMTMIITRGNGISESAGPTDINDVRGAMASRSGGLRLMEETKRALRVFFFFFILRLTVLARRDDDEVRGS